jgi:nucleotide-binding universal stress UspA family protein
MFSKVLVPLDRSSLAEQAVGQAAAIARASHAIMDLVLVHEPLQSGANDQLRRDSKYLELVATEVSAGASVPVNHTVTQGAPADAICGRARDIGADLIVMTSHGRTGMSRMWLGSVADAVVRRSSIPVLMLRPVESSADRFAAKRLFARVLVPLDGSRMAADVLDAAAGLAQCSHATVLLLRIVQPVPMMLPYDINQPLAFPPSVPDMEATNRVVQEVVRDMEEIARAVRERAAVTVEPHVIVGSRVADDIIDFARAHDVDVVAMSTRGRGASRILLGSVADKLLRASELPILLRRPAPPNDDGTLLTSDDIAGQLPALSLP